MSCICKGSQQAYTLSIKKKHLYTRAQIGNEALGVRKKIASSVQLQGRAQRTNENILEWNEFHAITTKRHVKKEQVRSSVQSLADIFQPAADNMTA